MKRSRFTEEQIIGVLQEAEAGSPAAEVCRRRGWWAPGKRPDESSERPRRTAMAPKPAIAIWA